jgi:CRP-like cAMP-binding protein
VIDRIRQDIQDRLDQLLAEADKLRRALSALDPRERSRAPDPQRSTPTATTPAATRIPATSAPARAASGETKAKVISALSGNGALTAGEVANATGLGRQTVSTTLSKLAKSGEISKAERGYRLRASADAPDAA